MAIPACFGLSGRYGHASRPPPLSHSGASDARCRLAAISVGDSVGGAAWATPRRPQRVEPAASIRRPPSADPGCGGAVASRLRCTAPGTCTGRDTRNPGTADSPPAVHYWPADATGQDPCQLLRPAVRTAGPDRRRLLPAPESAPRLTGQLAPSTPKSRGYAASCSVVIHVMSHAPPQPGRYCLAVAGALLLEPRRGARGSLEDR